MKTAFLCVATGAVAAILLSGCAVKANFAKTESRFVVHESTRTPDIFMHSLPSRPFAPVGIIETAAKEDAELSEVIQAAAEKGQEVGCDLVIDRMLYRVSLDVRWIVEVDAPMRRRRSGGAEPAVRQGALGFGPMYGQTGPNIFVNNDAPRHRREFICGVYTN